MRQEIKPERIPRMDPEPHWKPEDKVDRTGKTTFCTHATTQISNRKKTVKFDDNEGTRHADTTAYPTESRVRQKEKHRHGAARLKNALQNVVKRLCRTPAKTVVVSIR